VKQIHEELRYPRPPAEVFALIATGAFQLELIAHLGGNNPEVIEEERGPDGSVRLVTRQSTAVELPAFARKLIPANTAVTQVYDWGPPADGHYRGTWSAAARGAPVSIGGPTELRPDAGGGCVHVYGGEVKASVPVVGGRLESFALDNLRRDLIRTHIFTTERLAG
jgi:hypothetical protein